MKPMNVIPRTVCALFLALLLPRAACAAPIQAPAEPATASANAAWYQLLDFADEKEWENALRGTIELSPKVIITRDDGVEAWNTAALSGLPDKAPDTVNPSLWRHTQLNAAVGLFKVCDGIYQVRGYDMANATFIRTDNGWIVFDVLMCAENMKAALDLMEKHFGTVSVKAVLYSHSHVDHFGGIEGLISKNQVADSSLDIQSQLASGKIPIIAPEGFLEHAVSENIYAGTAMARRAQYQYGTLLEKGEKGSLAMGIGMGQSVGTVSLFPPTWEITQNTRRLTIDGLEIEFQLTPGTEAPAEMNAYFPKYRALWLAENCTGTMHNLYTLRGAQVRDGSAWAKYILEAEQLFGDTTDVVFQSHNWPHWGAEIKDYLLNTASVYKFIHDQTLHYMNKGLTPAEISRVIKLPDALERVWYTRQYYGTLSHNSKAVYQRYLGWYDANPVHLNLLTPQDSAKKLVEYLGSSRAVLEKARKDFEKGEYQWVAQITKELVFADPTDIEARNLCADALEQLGYQAESGTWRNAYLTGALEMRRGNQASRAKMARGLIKATMSELPLDMILDFLSVMSDSNAAQHDDLTLNITVTDTDEKYYIVRRHGVLLYYKGETRPDAEASLICSRAQLTAVFTGEEAKDVKVEGNPAVLTRLMKYSAPFKATFNIIEP
ncbi:MAG: alkyl sulfatase dimerization domain-containing protein [Pyramidobacter sp.]|nr:alkyl sulfatase dimerization domain-containing protein [Pyramidobacter sp.]